MSITNLTVLGAGTMGHGIAQKAIMSGINTTLFDIDQAFIDKAIGIITKTLDKHFVAKGKLTQEEMNQIMARLSGTTDLAKAAAKADFVIEAVPENMKLKKDLFAKLDQLCPAHTILSTNTSVMSVTAIGGATKRPDKCIGTHFFNPAAVMKLVEVVTPIGVSPETVQITFDFCKQLGKVPVKVKDVPGFIVNRLLCPLYMGAAQIVLEGTATAEEVDTAMKLGAGHPMGPCELADFGGFDVIQMAQDSIWDYTHKDEDRLNILYRKMLEAGRLGKKNGKGFYDYLPDGTKKNFNLF